MLPLSILFGMRCIFVLHKSSVLSVFLCALWIAVAHRPRFDVRYGLQNIREVSTLSEVFEAFVDSLDRRVIHPRVGLDGFYEDRRRLKNHLFFG